MDGALPIGLIYLFLIAGTVGQLSASFDGENRIPGISPLREEFGERPSDVFQVFSFVAERDAHRSSEKPLRELLIARTICLRPSWLRRTMRENKKGKWNEETTLYIGCCFDAPGCLLKAGGYVLTTSGRAESFNE
jgi:hypothetical protein